MNIILIMVLSGLVGFAIQIVIYKISKRRKWVIFLLPTILFAVVVYISIKYANHTSIMDPLSTYLLFVDFIYLPGLIGSIVGGIIAACFSYMADLKR